MADDTDMHPNGARAISNRILWDQLCEVREHVEELGEALSRDATTLAVLATKIDNLILLATEARAEARATADSMATVKQELISVGARLSSLESRPIALRPQEHERLLAGMAEVQGETLNLKRDTSDLRDRIAEAESRAAKGHDGRIAYVRELSLGLVGGGIGTASVLIVHLLS